MEFITKEFMDKEWKKEQQTEKQYIFTKNDMEFAITKREDKVYVSSPLKQSNFNYETSFNNNNFFEINSYISDKLEYLNS